MSEETNKAGAMLNRTNRDVLKTVYEGIRGILEKAGLFSEDDSEEKAIKEYGSAFTVTKDVNGEWTWRAVWSNDFKDRDDEILRRSAHDKYVARLDAGLVPMPSLWYWHTKGTQHGTATWVGRVGHMMLAVGTFDDNAMAKAFIEHYQKERNGVSHGFTYPKWAKKDGVYEDYNTFEISPLPLKVAANPYTFQEVIMADVNPEKQAHLELILGKEEANRLLSSADEYGKQLADAGVNFKAFEDFADVEAAKKQAETKGDSAVLGGLLVDLVQAQGALKERQDALELNTSKELEAVKQTNAKLSTENEELRKENNLWREKMKMNPRASISADNIVEDKKAKEDIEEKQSELDPFWKQFGVKVAKENGNG